MKKTLRGGLLSLIPNRGLEDPDDVLDNLDNELEEAAEEEVVQVESEPVKKAVAVKVEEDQVEDKKSELPIDESEDLPMPDKPLVTPLVIEVEEDLEKIELAEKDEPVKAVAEAEMEEEVRPVPVEQVSKKAEIKSNELKWDQHEGDVQHILIDNVSINPGQPRREFDQQEMDELVSSIDQHGILQPLVVRRLDDDNYELVAGERRLRAAKTLEWNKVPCVVRRGVKSGASRLELALVENIQREDLNPLEVALAYQQLNEEYGMTHEEIGERVGRSRVNITNTIRVLQLPDEVQQALSDGKITPGHARAILMIPDEDKQIRFYRHLLEEGLTVRKAETRARRIQRTMNVDDPMRLKRKGRSAYELKYSGLLEDRFGYDARVVFKEDRNRFEVVFKCHTKEDVTEMVGRLMGTHNLPEADTDKDVIGDGDLK